MGTSQSRSRGTSSGHEPSRPLPRKVSQKFSYIGDGYKTLHHVTNALREAGLESSNLIVGIDFTKSNEWTGKFSFNNRSLHDIGTNPNPYEQAISILGRTLASFDEDNFIPCFGFGDASTHDQYVFSFYEDHHPCHGFADALARYRQIAPNLRLSGPTSFAPVIRAAMRTVEESGGQYHVLVIIADGQVTYPQEKATIDAIVEASEYPLSIVLVGVGDGPWEMMRQFDDNIPSRSFDNFQFVNFKETMAEYVDSRKKEAHFALAALMEVPQQYKATIELELLGRQTRRPPIMNVLRPPLSVLEADRLARESGGTRVSVAQTSGVASSQGFQHPPVENIVTQGIQSGSRGWALSNPPTQEATSSGVVSADQLCPVCMCERKDMAFSCGHQTCQICSKELQICPLCRQRITTRIRLY